MFNMKSLALCSILIGGMGIGSSFAQSPQTANLTVTATVTGSCSITAGTLALTYDPVVTNLASAATGSTTLAVACTSGTNGTITLGQGLTPLSTSTDAVPVRQAANGTNLLTYYLYQDAVNSHVWGNTAASGEVYPGTGTQGSVTVYGAIPAAQTTVPAGTYSDTVVATITF